MYAIFFGMDPERYISYSSDHAITTNAITSGFNLSHIINVSFIKMDQNVTEYRCIVHIGAKTEYDSVKLGECNDIVQT